MTDRPRAVPRTDGQVLTVISAGGALGAVARWSAGRWWPSPPGTFPWTTFGINVLGCALIGLVMVLLTEHRPGSRLLRPFVVTGILGGFTTFSTYGVDTLQLVEAGRWTTALLYVGGTVVAAIGAVVVATGAARRVLSAGRS